VHEARNTTGNRALALGLAAFALACGGCSVHRLVMNRVGDALAGGGAVYAGDPDPELVGAATPFGLKLLESISAETPRHPGVLLALASGFTQYAYAFVELPADVLEDRDVTGAYAQRARARALYLRARDYGLRGLEVAHPGFRARLAADPAAAVALLRRDDLALAYWTTAAWGAAISLGKDDADLVAGLAAVRALAARGLVVGEDSVAGGWHLLAVSLTMSEGGPEEERIRRAGQHLERAVALTGGHAAAPYVTYAEAVSVPCNRHAEFDAMLARALAVDLEADPTQRLANTLYQRRARWLAGRADALFTD
jgi:predicted anti-sigma-YlaC factor YlaD